VFDAVMSRRCYKPAYPLDRSLEILRDARGAHFDPVVVDSFFDNLDRINEIRDHFPDD
jgi:response regulator RpfG family c-di-GMP phosphodiesterase